MRPATIRHLVVTAALVVPACGGRDEATPPVPRARPPEPEVTVDGPVGRLVADHVVALGRTAEATVTVVWARAHPEVRAGSVVRATGTVVTFDLAAIERRLAVDLDDDRVAALAGQDVLVARQLEVRTPGGGTGR